MNYRFWKYNSDCVTFTNEAGARELGLTDADMITPPNAQEIAAVFHRLLPGRTVYMHRDYLEVGRPGEYPIAVMDYYCGCREPDCRHQQALREATTCSG